MPRRGKKITDDERDRIVDLYQRGNVMREVAVLVDRSYGAVNAVLNESPEVVVSSRGGYRRRGASSTGEQ
jgi:hypothetical protein